MGALVKAPTGGAGMVTPEVRAAAFNMLSQVRGRARWEIGVLESDHSELLLPDTSYIYHILLVSVMVGQEYHWKLNHSWPGSCQDWLQTIVHTNIQEKPLDDIHVV